MAVKAVPVESSSEAVATGANIQSGLELNLGLERLPTADITRSHVSVDVKSELGKRLNTMIALTHSADTRLVVSFFDQGVERTCTAEWYHGKKNSKEVTVGTADGKSFSADLISDRALSTPLASFNDQSRIPFAGARYFVDLPLDTGFQANTPYAALIGERRMGEQRFIVTRKDPESPRHDERLPSARFVEIQEIDGKHVFVFQSDGGTQFSVAEPDIREIHRAGKKSFIVDRNSCRYMKNGDSDLAIDIGKFSAKNVNEHFALHQKVDLTYMVEEEKGRHVESFKGTYLGFHQVPTFDAEHRPIPGSSQSYLFLLGEEPNHQIFAVCDQHIIGMQGHVEGDSPVGGRAREPGLGQLPAYTSGAPIFQQDKS